MPPPARRAGGSTCGSDDLAKPGTDQIKLAATGQGWKTASLGFAVPADKDRGFSLYLSNYGVGAKNTLYARTVRLFDLTDGSGAAAACRCPAPAGYRLDLAKARPFARRYRKDQIIESQGEGTLPAGWSGTRSWRRRSADVFVDSVGGTPALGLRNHEGPPSVELFAKTGLFAAKAGKKYAVRVTYQTEANGKGGCQVFVNGEETGGTAFAPSVGAWKDVELTVAATVDGPLTMTVTCGSGGSEASVFVKAIEIKEAP